MFHHHNGVAYFLKMMQYFDEPLSVARMQPYGWFIEDVERTDKRRPQARGKVDALAFAAGKRG